MCPVTFIKHLLELTLASNICTLILKECTVFSLENKGRKCMLLCDVLYKIKATRLNYAPQSQFCLMNHQGWIASPGEERELEIEEFTWGY